MYRKNIAAYHDLNNQFTEDDYYGTANPHWECNVANLTTGIWHGDKFGSIITSSFKGALIGAAIGGVIGGIDAELKGQRFRDGKGKTPVERYLTGTGSNPEPSEMSPEKVMEHSDVASEGANYAPNQRGHITGEVNSSQFEDNLEVKVRAWPQDGETFYIKVDEEEVFSTTKFNFRETLTIKSGKTIGWGIRGTANANYSGIGGNVFADVVSVPSSYLIIKGQWRSWAGFLFW